jgi:hypothetical protein
MTRWQAALLIVKRYGDDAMLEASMRADQLLDEGDLAGAETWHRIFERRSSQAAFRICCMTAAKVDRFVSRISIASSRRLLIASTAMRARFVSGELAASFATFLLTRRFSLLANRSARTSSLTILSLINRFPRPRCCPRMCDRQCRRSVRTGLAVRHNFYERRDHRPRSSCYRLRRSHSASCYVMTISAALPFRHRPCFDLSMSLQLSDDPRDKLRAVLHHDLPAPDANYRQAVTAWYVALSDHDVLVVARAAHAHGKGDEAAAERYAAALPPAPKRPL